MKSIYEVSYSDYGCHESYGTFEEKSSAIKLCEEVNQYYKDNNIEQEAVISERKIHNINDKVYRYKSYLNIKENIITVESIVPTYNPSEYNEFIESIKNGLKRGQPTYGIVKFGVSQEQAIQKVKAIYNQLIDENLLVPLLELMTKKEQENQ